MQRARVVEVGVHSALVLEVSQHAPTLAAAYMAQLPFSTDPRLSLRWFAAMALLLRLLPHAQQAFQVPNTLPIMLSSLFQIAQQPKKAGF